MTSGFKSVRVKDIILNKDHEQFSNRGGYDAIGTITYSSLDETSSHTEFWGSQTIAKPLFSFLKSYPLINEVVLIINAVDDSIYKLGGSSTYYLPNLNIWNHPHHNALPHISNLRNTLNSNTSTYEETESGLVRKSKDESIKAFLGSYFKEKIDIRPLIPYEGDTIIEGRFGNSIRFGATVSSSALIPEDNLNGWSKEGPTGNPITIIRNGQYEEVDDKGLPINPPKGWISSMEDINKDHPSIYLTSDQQLTDFIPASTHRLSFGAEHSQTPWQKKLSNPHLNITLSPNPKKQDFSKVSDEPVIFKPSKISENEISEEREKIYLKVSEVVEEKTEKQEIYPSDQYFFNEQTKPLETDNPSGSLSLNGGINQKIGKYYSLGHLMYSKNFASSIYPHHLITKDNPQVESSIDIKNPESPIEDELLGVLTINSLAQNKLLKDTEGINYELTGELKGFPEGKILKKEISSISMFKENKPYNINHLINYILDDFELRGNKIFEAKYKSTNPKEGIWNINLTNRLEAKGGTINNYPGVDIVPSSEEIKTNLEKLIINCIDPIKDAHPDLIITSAYRSKSLNNKIGGSPSNSEHILGQAVDIKSKANRTQDIFNWCVDNLEEWQNLFWAYPERGNDSWIHISFIEGKNQKLTTLASELDELHMEYGGIRRGNNKQYQDNIKRAISIPV